MPKKKKYTVIGFYDSTGELFRQFVEATDASDAVIQAYNEFKKNGATYPENMNLVDVVKGHVESELENTSVCAFSDWPSIDDEDLTWINQ